MLVALLSFVLLFPGILRVYSLASLAFNENFLLPIKKIKNNMTFRLRTELSVAFFFMHFLYTFSPFLCRHMVYTLFATICCHCFMY